MAWLGLISRCPLFRPASLVDAVLPPGSQLDVAYRKMVRLHDSASYIRQQPQPRCKTGLDKTETWCNRLTAICQAVVCTCSLRCLSVCLCKSDKAQNLSVSFQHPSASFSGTAEQRDPINDIHLINGKRQDKTGSTAVQLAGTCALANVTSCMLGTFYQTPDGTSHVHRQPTANSPENSSLKQRPPPVLRGTM